MRTLANIDKTSPEFLEFFGALIGDGCIVHFRRKDANERYFYRIFITGNTKRDTIYLNYLCKILRQLGVNPYLHKRGSTNKANRNATDIVVNNQLFAKFLISLGFPSGKKGQIEIPAWAMELPLEKKFEIIRGLFDTDGSMSARKSEHYRRPMVLIDSGSAPLRKQLRTILRYAGLPAYGSSETVGISGAECTKKWFKLIGSHNPRNLDRFNGWMSTGKLPMLDIKNN